MIRLNYFVEVPEEMIVQLQQILEGLQQEVTMQGQKIQTLEQEGQVLVQYVQNLTQGLEGAATQFDEDQAFGEFDAQFGEKLSPFEGNMRALHGQDYDFKRDMFALSRDQEDVGAFIDESIEKVKAALLAAAEGLQEVQEIAEGAGVTDSEVATEEGPGEINASEITPEMGLTPEEISAASGEAPISPEVEALIAEGAI